MNKQRLKPGDIVRLLRGKYAGQLAIVKEAGIPKIPNVAQTVSWRRVGSDRCCYCLRDGVELVDYESEEFNDCLAKLTRSPAVEEEKVTDPT